MLKNKEERQRFLEDENNWTLIYDLSNIGLKYYEIKFKDNISLIKIESYQYYDQKGQYFLEGYRILDRTNFTLSRNIYYISACIEFLKKHELER